MKNENFENIVIGAGSGGLTVAIGLAMQGKKVALIESNHVGGDCTNVGCIPSKTLIHLAANYHPGDDIGKILEKVTQKRDDLRIKETDEVGKIDNLHLIFGQARFTGPKMIRISSDDKPAREITGKNVIIATGARPRLLEIPGLPADRMLTNESLFDITTIPDHLAIIGAGIIAIELAFAFRKLGTKVSLIALDPRALPTYSPDVSAAIQPELDKLGIETHYNATGDSFDESTHTLTIRSAQNTYPLNDVDKVLIAIGRIRNIDNLGLDSAGVLWGKTGIIVDGFGQTNVKAVYAVGDVTPTSAFTHSANAQGRRVVQKIAFPWLPLKKSEPLVPTSVFSDPEIATVGLSQSQINKKYHSNLIKSLRVDLKSLDRGYTDDVENGFIHVDVIRLTGRILGATIVGPRASEMISFFTLAISQKISLYKLFRLVYPYPTYSSGILDIADNFLKETLQNLPLELLNFLRYRLMK